MTPRRADPRIRAGLLTAARDLFLAKGYAATGVEEICVAAGATKGALFHHWGDKAELAAEVLAEWTRAGREAYSKAPFWEAPRAVERLLGYVDFTIELSRQAPLGCLVGILALASPAGGPNLRGLCARAFQDWASGLADLLEQAQQEEHVTPHFDSQGLAEHFVAVFEGAQVLAKARQSRNVIADQLGHYRAYLLSLFGLGGAAPVARSRSRARGLSRTEEDTMQSPRRPRKPVARQPRPEGSDPGFAPVVQAFAGRKGVELTGMFGSAGLKTGGKVFAMAVKETLVVKLPRERVESLVASGQGSRFDPGHGKAMREWVVVDAGGPSWLELAEEAHGFVASGR